MEDDFSPQVYTSGNGTWLVVWLAQYVNGEYVRIARSTDGGANWAPAQIYTWRPAVTPSFKTDGTGVWIGVWRQQTSVYYTRSTDDGVNWSYPTSLSSTMTTSTNVGTPVVDVDGAGNWVVAWPYDSGTGGPPADWEIAYSRSTDDGFTWTNGATLNSNASADSRDDQGVKLGVGPSGRWTAIWLSTPATGFEEGDVLYATSSDGGSTWSAVSTFTSGDDTDDKSPNVWSNGAGGWVATWWRSRHTVFPTPQPISQDIFFSNSTDNAGTWSVPARLTPASLNQYDYHVTLVPDGPTKWAALWERRFYLTDSDLMSAVSTDSGATWTLPLAVNSDATSDSLEETEVTVQRVGPGTLVAAWKRSTKSIRDSREFVYSRSTDSGVSWSAPTSLNVSAASVPGRFPGVSFAGDLTGRAVAAWSTQAAPGGATGFDSDIMVVKSNDLGTTWNAPAVIDPTAFADQGDSGSNAGSATDGANNWVTVWQADGLTAMGDTDIFVSHRAGVNWSAPIAVNPSANLDTGDDSNPAIATDRAGNWLVVWSSNQKGSGDPSTDYDLFASRSTGLGQTWSPPVLVNSNAATDFGNDVNPRIATDRAGRWIVTWASNEGTTGSKTEYDIYTATSNNNGSTWNAPAVVLGGDLASFNDQHPDIAATTNSVWMVSWRKRDWPGTVATAMVARSTNGGVSWTTQSLATFSLKSLRVGRPSVATDWAGNWVITLSDQRLWKYVSADNGATFGAGEQVLFGAVSSDWEGDPFVASDENGKWTLAWSRGPGFISGSSGIPVADLATRGVLSCSDLTLPGAWSGAPSVDHGNNAGQFPSVAMDSAGRSILIYDTSPDTVNPTYSDSLISVSTAPGATVDHWSLY
ncbi:MAG: hypothetical protein K1X53_00650 [Candidatus Sumerlaeaceae bacterium]|nr:hypothetical protein [Candidatus Sumerlaeaceae bacterium]